MSQVVRHITTIKESPMVMLVSGYIATTHVAEHYPDGIDEDGEQLTTQEIIEITHEAEQKAYKEYADILDAWADGEKQLRRAARLAEMLSEANYLSISSVSGDSVDSDYESQTMYARECAYEFAKCVRQSVRMLRKTTRWTEEFEGPGDSQAERDVFDD